MEKRTPHCNLKKVKALLKEKKVRTTRVALVGAELLGINYDEMLSIVGNLTRSDFYKSMTTHADYKIWQDVYRPNIEPYGDLYIKLTVVDDVLIVSFKER